MTIGERIKARRIELNLTQDELAIKVGYKSRSSINKIESSRSLPLSKIEKMADALETNPSVLMGWLDDEYERLAKEDENRMLDIYLSEDEATIIRGYRIALEPVKHLMLEAAKDALKGDTGRYEDFINNQAI